MLQNTLSKTLPQTKFRNSELRKIKGEIRLLRSFIIGLLGEDKEGQYKPKFVKEILKAAKETPTRSFDNTKSFLKQLCRL